MSARETATFALQKIIKEKVFFSEIKESIPTQDAPFVNMLVLSALRHLVFIKKSLKQFAKKKLPEKVSIAEYALILGTTEILYLNTPDYAVINSYVEIVKKHTDQYVAGFINAVLRKICKEKDKLIKEDNGLFFPPEFSRILNLDYNKKTIAKIEKIAILEPPLDISITKETKLTGKKLDNETIRLENDGKISELPDFQEGTWWVQDFAASLAVKTLGNIKDKRVLDLCAAPGGKTAQLINKGAKVTALDISQSRLDILGQNLQRLKMKTEKTIAQDGLEYLKNFSEEAFDIILLDAPCSATGTLRRHPEIVHIKNLKDIEKQASFQEKFLEHVSKALKPNGILVYCTCSISKLEGEIQIVKFLEDNQNFKALPITEKEVSYKDIINEDGFIRTLPHHLANLGGMDSFFVAKLQKVSE